MVQQSTFTQKRRLMSHGESHIERLSETRGSDGGQCGAKKARISCDPGAKQSQSILPDPMRGSQSPDKYLISLFEAMHGKTLKVQAAADLKDFFHVPTEDELAGYTIETLSAARTNNVDQLKKLREEGKTLVCFNRYGESMLHLACKRGFTEIVDLILEEPGATVRITDDGGRNPLHDTCWNCNPQVELYKVIMERDPSLFLIADKRGFTPFDYARSEHWTVWKQCMYDNRELLDKLNEPEFISRFS